MSVVRRGTAMDGEVRPPQGGFNGKALQRPLHEHTDPSAVRVSIVQFEAGAHTHWHAHGGGQVLHVVEGEGRTQSWGGSIEGIRTGDSVVTAAGEKHWHGAGAQTPMAHLAITIGQVTWLEPVETAAGPAR